MNELGTEEKIIIAARNIFTKKGMNGARMQEIADEAGINKALLHYYYRNKEQLFFAVLLSFHLFSYISVLNYVLILVFYHSSVSLSG